MSDFGGNAPGAPGTSGQGSDAGQGGGSTAVRPAPGSPGAPGTAGQGGDAGTRPGQAGQPVTATPEQFKQLHARTQQENADLKRRVQMLETSLASFGTMRGGSKPPESNGFSLPQDVADHLGLNESQIGTLNKVFTEFVGSQVGSVKEMLEAQANEGERIQFFNQYPRMREYQSHMDQIDEGLNAGTLKPIQVIAMAAAGANMEALFAKRLAAEHAKWEKEERGKIHASVGPGQPITPEEHKTAAEGKRKEAAATFGVKDPKYTNKPKE